MPNMLPEFSRRVSVNRISAGGLEQTIRADSDERRALAVRLQIPGIASLTCSLHLEPALRGQIAATGDLRAEVTRICVISLEPFEATVRERFSVRFVPQDSHVAGREEDEIDPDAPDELAFIGEMIDLGETASEQLALALDPYPRMPGVVTPPELLSEGEAITPLPAGEVAEPDDAGDPHPFAGLARLRGGNA